MIAATENRYCPKCGLATNALLCANDGTSTLHSAAMDASALQFRPGDVLAGRYRLIRTLGRGGFGAVYAAEHTSTGQQIAIKILAVEPGAAEEDAGKRFFQEARITSQLRHPNTVRLFDFGQSESGALFMALELIQGPTLERVLRDLALNGKTMAENDALDMAIAVLRSLAEAHTAELVHRDLKPANIMFADVPGEDPVVKVLDFGIARAKDSSLTGGGTVLGTPAYMSPEQCRGAALDGRSDLYSLAIILFRCVTGRVPFSDPSPLSVMYQHEAAEVPDLRALTAEPLSDGFIECVLHALAKRPAERFPDARSMRLALEAVRGGAWAGTPQPGWGAPIDRPTLAYSSTAIAVARVDRPAVATAQPEPEDLTAATKALGPRHTAAWLQSGADDAAALEDLAAVPDRVPTRARWPLAVAGLLLLALVLGAWLIGRQFRGNTLKVSLSPTGAEAVPAPAAVRRVAPGPLQVAPAPAQVAPAIAPIAPSPTPPVAAPAPPAAAAALAPGMAPAVVAPTPRAGPASVEARKNVTPARRKPAAGRPKNEYLPPM